MPTQLCLDIDNVLAQTDPVIRQLISVETGGRVQLAYEDVSEFDYCACSDSSGAYLTRDEWGKVLQKFSSPELLTRLQPANGASQGVQWLSDRYEVHIVTSRLPEARDTTLGWLERHGFPTQPVHFVEHGQKHRLNVPFDYAVEDHYEQAVRFTSCDTACFLISHPWNRNKASRPKLEWVADWPALVEKLNA
jgi:5'(3')-deoxyribonucleotidase